ncbi:DUF4912 domain-containing protein [Myxococcus stipitatus]|uniref:DUF4912 domain-containing protein n=1 Tax=Myxococcus stipitatus TaxID=83455 RepID=UPI001F3EB39B|nr:DUF4912 domain-containing protein [Myxococcus stipitatus]MCE9667264.1 DUF4912 domain-containing protein [Myxococcus stipitatus]
MDDLKSVTVGSLRELARKHLGSDYRKLKKREWIAALVASVPELARLARFLVFSELRKRLVDPGPHAPPSPAAVSGAHVPSAHPNDGAATDGPPERIEHSGSGRALTVEQVPTGRAPEPSGPTHSARPAHVVTFHPKPRVTREPIVMSPPSEPTPASTEKSSGTEAPMAQHPAEPVVEGFFVARVQGEPEVRRHHLQEAEAAETTRASGDLDEGLGGVPSEYADDVVLLLVRDPHTLFALWDFKAATRARAMQGLDSPRAVLRLFDGEALVREVDCPLDARGFYLRDLPAGRAYRLEVHFVGQDGRAQRIGSSSNRASLPSEGVSTDTTVRFMSAPGTPPAAEPSPGAAAAPRVEVREYVTWRRVPLPGSEGHQQVPEVHREHITHEVGVPVEVAGAGPHLETLARPAGASDERYAVTRRYLEERGRAPGASEQRYGDFASEAGAAVPRARTYEYLAVSRGEGGASEWRYESPSRPVPAAPGARPPYRHLDLDLLRARGGASDMRYAIAIDADARASDSRSFDARPRAPGASDLRYFDSPRRPSGASESRRPTPPPPPGARVVPREEGAASRASSAPSPEWATSAAPRDVVPEASTPGGAGERPRDTRPASSEPKASASTPSVDHILEAGYFEHPSSAARLLVDGVRGATAERDEVAPKEASATAQPREPASPALAGAPALRLFEASVKGSGMSDLRSFEAAPGAIGVTENPKPPSPARKPPSSRRRRRS